MQLHDTKFIHTASDLTDFLACAHLTRLEIARLHAGEKRAAQDEAAALIAAKGMAHELLYLQSLQKRGLRIVDLGGLQATPEEAAQATETAMESGADVIYQGVLYRDGWFGRTDFLERVESPGAHGAWSYEIVDTKLSLTARASAVMQICLYNELLSDMQGADPARLHIVLGDGTRASFESARFAAYFRSLKQAFLEHAASSAPTYPLVVAHCVQCSWTDACRQQRDDDDHLSLVANMRQAQIDRLQSAGIATMRELAAAGDGARPPGMAETTFSRLREQARLQTAARDAARASGKPDYRYLLLPPKDRQGFAKLPPPSAGDVYFDMEGDPLYAADHGLEYLFGNYLTDGSFKMFWAYSPDEERAAFEACVDFFSACRAADANMHVYHYAPYEKTALRRLALEYGTREEEVDDMLRSGFFVDLYEIVRQSVMISQPSYSIKKLEPFYDFTRATDVKKGDDSIVAFEKWRANPDVRSLLDDIESYNKDDCRSTYELRVFLDRLKSECELQYGVHIAWNGPPQREEGQSAEEASEFRRSRRLLVESLASRTVEDAAFGVLADVLPYHTREANPVWWEYFDRCDNADTLLESDGKALGGLKLDETYVPAPPKKANSRVTYRYAFPPQKFAGDDGDMHDAYLRESAGKIVQLETTPDGGFAYIGVKSTIDPRAITTLIPNDFVGTKDQQQRLVTLGARYAQARDMPRSCATELLRGAPPRLREAAPGARVQPEQIDGETLAALIAKLDASYLVIQGPPGTGKTTTGAAAICRLLALGLRIGITSRSHAAIDNIVAAIDRTAVRLGQTFRGLRKLGSDVEMPEYLRSSSNVRVPKSSQKAEQLFTADLQLFAATSWGFVAQGVPDGYFDLVFIDEAGQFSLADALALTAVAQNLVFLGDPLQLKQVARGSHPPAGGRSVLEHALGEYKTVPPERGVFLDISYRMHPSVCTFISENVYEGRLCAAPQTATQRIDAGAFSGSGLRFVPIAHVSNSRESKEECSYIARAIRDLTANGSVTDRDGTTRRIRSADVIVVTPYNAQRVLLERELQRHGVAGVAVGTVDKFQGQEAAVVFYSMATSSGADLPRDIDFLFQTHRFNVAISRAKAMCILVASPALLRTPCSSVEEIEMVNLLCRYVEEAEPIEPCVETEK